MEIILILLSGLSIALNIYQYATKIKAKERPLKVDAQELLAELLNGSAVVKIDVIDKSRIFLRSPKSLNE